MTRTQYLSEIDVAEFIEWLSRRLDEPGSFRHSYWNVRRAKTFECECLYDAFAKYEWNDKSFTDNQSELDELQKQLREAFALKTHDRAAAACVGILKWGGVSRRNGDRVRQHAEEILRVLEHDSALLTNPCPTLKQLSALHKFNSGFAKIFSLLLDDLIIYDSRVGAALGALVRDWCKSSGRMVVPQLLHFRWSHAQKTKRGKNRNPSQGTLRFSSFAGQEAAHALCAIRATWVLRSTASTTTSRFSQQANPIRGLEAALFMVGYDLGLSV